MENHHFEWGKSTINGHFELLYEILDGWNGWIVLHCAPARPWTQHMGSTGCCSSVRQMHTSPGKRGGSFQVNDDPRDPMMIP